MKSLTAIAEWAADASDRLLFCCGAALRDPDRPCRAPSEATVRRVLQRIDGIVLAQREVDAKSNEITAFRPLLDPLDLTGAVVTFDAVLTQTDHAKFLVEEKGAHYIADSKAIIPVCTRW
ncbi:hypothetical protein ACGF3K_26030 [Streptomyces sp. NPDC047980]|uniref:hypothetical protein n=1 Tax=Streptomyces sp. NPDC047980 TaxID=3365494 RepID=UPI00371492A5